MTPRPQALVPAHIGELLTLSAQLRDEAERWKAAGERGIGEALGRLARTIVGMLVELAERED